ncbi:MAG: hypothetical protein KBA55_05160 [Ruminococcus sp.]|nr:hypothetical protein [Ruminococcus sp.]
MEKIGEFFSEYGGLLLCGLPVLALLVILFGIFIKMLIKNPKSMLGALFTVLGVIALYLVIGLIVEEKNWDVAVIIFLIGGIALWYTLHDPKGMVRIILTAAAAIAVLVGIGRLFGIGPAVLVGLNGIMALLMYLPFKYLIETIKLEKKGAQTTGTVIGRTYGRSAGHIIGYTDIDGNYHSGKADLMLIRWWKNGTEVDVLYDCEDTDKFTVKTRGLLNSIFMFSLFFIIQAAVLVGSIWFYLSIA